MTYSCIVAGSAACEGYAKAAKYLLEKAEIECFTLVGDAQNFEGETESHMWNIVNIDGEYYHLDTTWDDPDGSESGMSHIYMNLNDDEIKKFLYGYKMHCGQSKLFCKRKLPFFVLQKFRL